MTQAKVKRRKLTEAVKELRLFGNVMGRHNLSHPMTAGCQNHWASHFGLMLTIRLIKDKRHAKTGMAVMSRPHRRLTLLATLLAGETNGLSGEFLSTAQFIPTTPDYSPMLENISWSFSWPTGMEYNLVPFVLEKVEVSLSGRLSPMVDNSQQVLPKK